MDWLGHAGKCVVVTGGSGGIGRATLEAFHGAGATVVALDYDGDAAKKAAAEIDPTGERAFGLRCDISSEEAVLAAAKTVAAKGGADILVNNAGILRPGPLSDLSLSDWTRMLEVNLNGCFLAARAFGAQMVAKRRGALVHIASISASQPQPFSGAYSPGKAAVAMLSRQIAVEWGPKGVRSNVVSPGLVLTPMSEKFYENTATKEARETMVPVGRIGRPQDMADAAMFLASERASYVNGQEIIVDGGLSQALMYAVPRPGFAEN